MISFEIKSAGKYKLSLSRLSKITSSATFILYNDKYIIDFEDGLIQNNDINLIDSCVASEGVAFQFSTIKFHNLLKGFKGGETFLFHWDLKNNITIKPIQKVLKRKKQQEFISLKTTVKPIVDFKGPESYNFDFDRLEQNVLPGKISVPKLIWVIEKISVSFEKIQLSFNNKELNIESECDSYSCHSIVDLIESSNITSCVNLSSEKFLNIIWLIEFNSDMAYIFCNPKTFDICLACTNEENHQIMVIL